MKIPDIKMFITITERVGVPTLLCLIFGWIYFVKLDKLIDDLADIHGEITVAMERVRNDHEEIKRELRRTNWTGRRNP